MTCGYIQEKDKHVYGVQQRESVNYNAYTADSETLISLLLGEMILVPHSDEANMLKNVCFKDKSFPSLPISSFHSHQPITCIL